MTETLCTGYYTNHDAQPYQKFTLPTAGPRGADSARIDINYQGEKKRV
jgi:hypothetical protein